jgi:hypothetical protein
MSSLESSDSGPRSDLEDDLWEGQLAFTGHSSPRANPPLGIHHYFKSDFQTLICKVKERASADAASFVYFTADVLFFSRLSDFRVQVQFLQQQISALADTQFSSDDRYSRTKQENAALNAR